METKQKSSTSRTALFILMVISWSVYAILLAYAIYLLMIANASHDPSDMNGLAGAFAVVILFVSGLPFSIALIATVYWKKAKEHIAVVPSPPIAAPNDVAAQQNQSGDSPTQSTNS